MRIDMRTDMKMDRLTKDEMLRLIESMDYTADDDLKCLAVVAIHKLAERHGRLLYKEWAILGSQFGGATFLVAGE